MAIQQNRIIRFLMVIGIVVLTIFIYASYYSNPAMTIPTRMHSYLYSNSLDTSSAGEIDALAGGLGGGKIKQNIKNSVNINNNSGNKSKIQLLLMEKISGNNKIYSNSERDSNNASLTLQNSINRNIPKSNIQIVVQNADSILRNLTSSTSTTTASIISNSSLSSSGSSNINDNSIKKNRIQKPLSVLANLPQSPSIVAVRVPLKTDSQLNSTQVDPSKGVIASMLYESGHLDINPNLCPDEGQQLRLLIIITSAPTHHDARLAIRQTWGHYAQRRDVSIAFILGRTQNQQLEELLNSENYMYGDLIRGRFIDSYNNLTLKTLSTLEFVDKNCPLANFVLKTDDDMFINVPKLLQFIEKHHQDHRVIYGRLAKKWKPIRNKKSKYYVAPGQFSQNIFPQFTTGPAYLMSSDVIHDLYCKALEQTYLKLEDVFTTGIVAQLINIKRIHVNEFLNRRIAFNPCNIRKAISVHMIKSNEQFDLWKKLLDTTTKCK